MFSLASSFSLVFVSLRALAVAVGLALAAAMPAVAAPISFNVSVDTSSVAPATAGFIDFQFNPLFGGTPATATVSGFASDAILGGAPLIDGDVSGALPAMQTFGNSTPFNASLQDVVGFGSFFSFLLTLDVQPSMSADPSAFFVGIYDLDFNALLGSDAASGLSLSITVAPGAAPVVAVFDAAAIQVVPVNDVPEPATLALVLVALLAGAGGAAQRWLR